jgi:two-component system NtrC family sensor kinase
MPDFRRFRKSHVSRPFFQFKALLQPRARSIVLSIVFGTIIPLVTITLLLSIYFRKSYRDEVILHLKELLENHKNIIEVFLNKDLDDIRFFVHSSLLGQLKDSSFLQQNLSTLQNDYGSSFVDLGLIDDRGIQISYAGPFNLQGVDYSDAQWLKEAIKKESYVSDVFLGGRKASHFIVAVKLTEGGREWIFRSTVNFKNFNYMVENLRRGRTGMAYIINRKGVIQTRPPLSLSSEKKLFQNLLINKIDFDKIKYTTVFEDKVFGKKCLFVLIPLKKDQWILVFQQEAKEAFSVLYHARNLTIIFFVIGSIGFITTFLLSRQVVNQLINQVKSVSKEKEAINGQLIKASKLSSIGELAAGVAHEINNPVAIMVEEAGWIGDLLEEEDSKYLKNYSEISQSLNQIKTQGKRCKDITHQLLSFARKTDSDVEALKLNNLIKEIVALSQQRARYRNVKIETDLNEFLPSINVSPSEMQQILLNMINNAFDAINSKGGTITIRSRVDKDYIIVDVADTGMGIPEASIHKLFDPFYTTKPVGKGTGLGLSICYSIIQKKGGDIKVESEVGIGTTFHILIPRRSNVIKIPQDKKDSLQVKPESIQDK